MQKLHVLMLNYMTLTLTKGHMISAIYCPLLWPVISQMNELAIYPYTIAVGDNVKTYIFMTFDLERYPLTPKSIGFISDLYRSMVLIMSSLGLTMPGKRW